MKFDKSGSFQDKIIFNSIGQYKRFKDILCEGKTRGYVLTHKSARLNFLIAEPSKTLSGLGEWDPSKSETVISGRSALCPQHCEKRPILKRLDEMLTLIENADCHLYSAVS